MNRILFFLFLLPASIHCQQTILIKDQNTNETYRVLAEDKATRHGEYIQFNHLGHSKKAIPIIKGYYKYGVKDSIWECFDFQGKPTMKYDFLHQKLFFYNEQYRERYDRTNTEDRSDTLMDTAPLLIGGKAFLSNRMLTMMKYPEEAAQKGISGMVEIKFIVDKNGNASNFHVEKPLGYGLDEEAIKILQSLSDYWIPATKNGQPIEVEYTYSIKFNLK